jgi:hypothetical protein
MQNTRATHIIGATIHPQALWFQNLNFQHFFAWGLPLHKHWQEGNVGESKPSAIIPQSVNHRSGSI